MAEIKDKVITAESLKTLHDYNKNTFETKENITSLNNKIDDIESSLNDKIDEVEARVTPIELGGTNSSDGAIGLANLFASGNTVLSSYQYGVDLPDAGTVGRIFFKKLSE